ncbi:MAG: PaaI family thioesterase [Ideonella sp.]|nr:MAG: PaaI family thioesterase [Burkholderiaceae bacterium]MBE7425439.1 PaaI family thioesterase [Ideonella sp.]
MGGASPAPDDPPQGFARLPIGGDFMAGNGPLYVRVVDGRTQVGFRVQQRHTNPLNICHGGMLATFGDMLLPVCIHRQSELGMRFMITVGLQLDYLAPAPLGAWVQGEAEVLRETRTLVFAQGVARVDDAPVLRVSGTFKIGQPFDRAVEAAGG